MTQQTTHDSIANYLLGILNDLDSWEKSTTNNDPMFRAKTQELLKRRFDVVDSEGELFA